MHARTACALGVAGLLALLAACGDRGREGSAGAQDAAERGRYLVAIMDCAGCHNAGAFSADPERGHLQGGTIGFEVPQLGIFYPPNLTPHPQAGLGGWTESQIITAIRTGRRPDGRILAPAMPWAAYSRLSEEDAAAIAAYLKGLPPSDRRVPAPSPRDAAPAPYLTVRQP